MDTDSIDEFISSVIACSRDEQFGCVPRYEKKVQRRFGIDDSSHFLAGHYHRMLCDLIDIVGVNNVRYLLAARARIGERRKAFDHILGQEG